MAAIPFALTPFPGEPAPLCAAGGTAGRQGTRLALTWTLTGQVAGVAWPEPAAMPERRDHLWQESCCECFLARPGEAGYWEMNLSPAGHWQLYRFDGYRAGMRPEAGIDAPAIVATRSADSLSLAATFALGPLIRPEEPLLLGVTMVVHTMAGAVNYWALAHPAGRPDFHHRAAFVLAL